MKKRAAEHDEFADIRSSVRALCAKFPGEYWRGLDRERAYPTEFVAALTEAGYLAALIPEEYGGSGLNLGAAAAILVGGTASGGDGGARHGAAGSGGRPRQFLRKCPPPVATAPPVTRRCTRWARSCGMAATRRKSATYR